MLSFLKRDKDEAPRKTRRKRLDRLKLRRGLAETRARLGGQLVGPVRAGTQARRSVLRRAGNRAAHLATSASPRPHYLLERHACARAARAHLEDAGAAHAKRSSNRLLELLQPIAQPLDVDGAQPFVIMLAGVNGAGKTTSIGKLANYYQAQGKTVLLAAGDTFRAAAREQLQGLGRAQQRRRDRAAIGRRRGGDLRCGQCGARRAASTSCSPTPPDGCRRSCT